MHCHIYIYIYVCVCVCVCVCVFGLAPCTRLNRRDCVVAASCDSLDER